jgi:hypothetical protein
VHVGSAVGQEEGVVVGAPVDGRTVVTTVGNLVGVVGLNVGGALV